jgi:hypothetical protein
MLEIAPNDYEFLPSMLPQFNYSVKDVEVFKAKVDGLKINTKTVHYREMGEGRFSVDLGQQNLKNVVVELDGVEIPFDQTGLENVVIEDKSSATAYHIPEGHCYIYHPSYKVSEMSSHQVSTRELMPTILQNFAVDVPSYSQKQSINILS